MIGVGVDWTESRVAVAAVEASGRSCRVLGTRIEPIGGTRGDPGDRGNRGGGPAAERIRALIRELDPRGSAAIATALPGRLAAQRLLSLPFTDARRLAATVPAELEGSVPLDLDGSLCPFTVLGRDGAASRVLAAIARKEDIAEHLARLAQAGIDPAIVDLGAVATLALLALQPGDALVAELRPDGAIGVVRKGALAGFRVLGGTTTSELLAEARWSALTLCGDGAIPPLLAIGSSVEVASSLATSLGTTTQPLARHLPPWAQQAPAEGIRALALAARAAGVLDVGLNFRIGELGYRAPRAEDARQLRSLSLLAAAVGALGLISLGATYAERRSEVQSRRDQIHLSTTAVLPSVTRGNERLQLQAAVDALEKRREILGGAPGTRTLGLESLRRIAEAIPARLAVQIDDLGLDEEGVRFHARTDSYESVDTIKRALTGLDGLHAPDVKDVKSGVDGRVEFRVQLAQEKSPAR